MTTAISSLAIVALGGLSYATTYIYFHIPLSFMRTVAVFRAGIFGITIAAAFGIVCLLLGVVCMACALAIRYPISRLILWSCRSMGGQLVRYRHLPRAHTRFVSRKLGGALLRCRLLRKLHKHSKEQSFNWLSALAGPKEGLRSLAVTAAFSGAFVAIITFPVRQPWWGGGFDKVVLYGAPEVLNADLRNRMSSWNCHDDAKVVVCDGVILIVSDDQQTIVAAENLAWQQISSESISIGRGR